MSRWTDVFVASLLAAAAFCLPAHAAGGSVTNRFESDLGLGGKRLVVVCTRDAAAAVPCGVDFLDAKAAAPSLSLEFAPMSSGQDYLARLAREAADAQMHDQAVVEGIPPTGADLAVLQHLAKDASACLAEKNNADLMLACPTGRRFEDAVVMLFRGLCDHCRFQPIVVRKVN